MMDYQKIIDIYKQDEELRFLIMKLPYEYKLYDLYKSMVKQNIIIETNSVKDIFENIKGDIEINERSWSSKLFTEHVHYNPLSRNLAVEFAFRIMNEEITNEDKKYLYNIILYILTHSHVFTDRIRHHLFDLISNKYNNLITTKQMNRINKDMKQYGRIHLNDESEYDSPDPEINLYNENDYMSD
jgi:hypothetical protein